MHLPYVITALLLGDIQNGMTDRGLREGCFCSSKGPDGAAGKHASALPKDLQDLRLAYSTTVRLCTLIVTPGDLAPSSDLRRHSNAHGPTPTQIHIIQNQK